MGQQAQHRLIPRIDEPADARRVPQGARPVLPRRARVDYEAEQRGTQRRPRGDDRGPTTADQHEEDDEQAGRQLQCGREADPDAAPRSAAAQGDDVGEDQREDEHVQLALAQGQPDRLQREDHGHRESHREPRGDPVRRATGATSHQVTRTTTAAEASRTRIATGPAGSQVSGTMKGRGGGRIGEPLRRLQRERVQRLALQPPQHRTAIDLQVEEAVQRRLLHHREDDVGGGRGHRATAASRTLARATTRRRDRAAGPLSGTDVGMHAPAQPLGRTRRLASVGDDEAPRAGSAGGLGGDQLGDLDGVERRALAEVVVADEQRQPAAVGGARVLADPADVARVPAGRLQRGGDVGELDPGRRRQQLGRPLDARAAARTRRSATASAR